MKRMVLTPLGMAELDVAGSERHAFVTVTLFGEDGWAAHEGSHQDEGLADVLARLTGMPSPEADVMAEDCLGTWRQRGGPEEGAAVSRRFGIGVIGVLLVVAHRAATGSW